MRRLLDPDCPIPHAGEKRPVLTRERIYATITRAKERVEVWGKGEIFKIAVSRRIEKISGLREALWG